MLDKAGGQHINKYLRLYIVRVVWYKVGNCQPGVRILLNNMFGLGK
jgi:hypothetical protein